MMRWLGLQLESIHSRDSHSLPHSPYNTELTGFDYRPFDTCSGCGTSCFSVEPA